MKWFILVLLIQFPILSKPILINDNFKSLVIGEYLEYYEDNEGKLTIEDVSKPEFQGKFNQSEVETLNFGYKKSAYWIKFQILSDISEKKDFLLEHSYPVIDILQFYFLNPEGQWTYKQTGDTFPFQQRDIKNRNFLFNIQISPMKKYTYYLKTQSTSNMMVPLKIYDKNSFIETINDERFVLGIYYGIILVMIIYNVLLYFSLKDSLYIYYVLYLTNFVFFQMGLNGISFEYIWNNQVYFNTLMPLFASYTSIFMLLFTVKFLNMKKNSPKVYYMLNGFVFVSLIYSIVAFDSFYYSILMKLISINVIAVSIIILFSSFSIYWNGYKPARLYLLAFSTLLVGMILFSLRALGLLPSNFFTNNTVQIGSALESVLLSLAVADKILFMRKEQEETKNQLIHNQQESIENQKKLIQSYARFIPEQLLTFLGKDIITQVNLGDSIQKDMTVLFSDIRSFTTLSESMTPEESFRFINSYLKVIAPCIRKYNGYIDKFIGDGIMALFPNKAQDAVDASIEMLDALNQLNLKRIEKGLNRISIGIGIHTGSQILGVIGETSRLEGTVISDVVNTASRLEGLTKAYSSALIISEEVFQKLENKERYRVRLLDTVKVKGKNKAIRILEVLNGLSPRLIELKTNTKEIFEKGIRLYTDQKFTEAIEVFKQVLELDPKDKASELYINRCNLYQKIGIDQNWTGIEALDFK